jgi:hypothetical protein
MDPRSSAHTELAATPECDFALFDQNFDRVGSFDRRDPLAQCAAWHLAAQSGARLLAIASAGHCHTRQSIGQR